MIDQDGPYCVSTSREGLHPISIAPLNASTSSLAHSLLYVKWCRSMRWGPSHVLYSTVAHCRYRRAPFIASSMVWLLWRQHLRPPGTSRSVGTGMLLSHMLCLSPSCLMSSRFAHSCASALHLLLLLLPLRRRANRNLAVHKGSFSVVPSVAKGFNTTVSQLG
jgi:hypothetical protein